MVKMSRGTYESKRFASIYGEADAEFDKLCTRKQVVSSDEVKFLTEEEFKVFQETGKLVDLEVAV